MRANLCDVEHIDELNVILQLTYSEIASDIILLFVPVQLVQTKYIYILIPLHIHC